MKIESHIWMMGI